MVASTEHKLYKKTEKKGQGNILKYIRTTRGLGKGLIAGAIVLLVVSIPVTIFFLSVGINAFIAIFMSVPGLIMLIVGMYLKYKRKVSWLSYYQKKHGFSEGEIEQINHELSSPSTTIVTCHNHIAGFFTDHYVVVDGLYPYVRRLEDIIAAAFSDSTDIWYMVILSVQDQETRAVTLFADSQKKYPLCMELIQEMQRRNPKILCGQEIVCDGSHYILERDGAQILRLYQEGRSLELAR